METKTCKGPCGLEKALTEFYDTVWGGKFATCKVCCKQATKQKRHDKTRAAIWSQYYRNTHLRGNYHIEPEQYQFQAEKQGNVCALCGKPDPNGKRLAVDHDPRCCPARARSCGKCIRGLLCSSCNPGLGFFAHDPELLQKAIQYLAQRCIVFPVLPKKKRALRTKKPENTCIVPGCGRSSPYRLYCQKHYFRIRRTGSVELKSEVA